MRILQINSDYESSSTGKITESLHTMLKQSGIESYVIYGRAHKNDIQDDCIYPVISTYNSKIQHFLCNIKSDPYGCCYFSTKRVIKKIYEINPDIVHLQCINGYFVNIYRLLEWLGDNSYKTVLTLHAEFMYTGGCDHAYDCLEWMRGCKNCSCETNCTRTSNSSKVFSMLEKAFSHFKTENLQIVSVSDWMRSRAMKSPILNRFSHFTVMNGIDTSIFYFRRMMIKEKDTLSLLHVSAGFNPCINDNKGGLFIVAIAQELIKRGIKATITVVASSGDPGRSLPPNIKFIGSISDKNKLAELYSRSDVFLITSKRESFSMPVAESLCCGTPIAGFLAGGPESIALKKHSRFVKHGDIKTLANEICSYLELKVDKEEISKEAKIRYSNERMSQEYLNIYNLLVRGI